MGRWYFLLVEIVFLSLPGQNTADIGAIACSAGVMLVAMYRSVRDECCDRCVPEGDCRATPFRASGTCCSTAESSILSVFTVDSSEDSEVCSSSSIYLGALELDQVFSGQTLQPGTYVMPNLTFSCSGCIEEVVVRVEDSSAPENVGIELLFWARYDPPEGENELHKILRRVPILTDNVVGNTDDLNLFNIIFNLSENKVCFTDREVFGFSSEGSGDLAVQLTPGSDQSVQVYQVTQSTDNNCSNLAEYVDLSSSVSYSGVPVISLRIRPTVPSPMPSTSASHSLPPSLPPASTTTEPVFLTLPPAMTSPSGTPLSTEGPSSDTTQETSSIGTLPIIVGVTGGVIAILMLLVVFVLLLVFLTLQYKMSGKDNLNSRDSMFVQRPQLEQMPFNEVSSHCYLMRINEAYECPSAPVANDNHSMATSQNEAYEYPTAPSEAPPHGYLMRINEAYACPTAPNEAYAHQYTPNAAYGATADQLVYEEVKSPHGQGTQ